MATSAAWAALVLVAVGLAVAWGDLFEPSYLWQRLHYMRAAVDLRTGEIVTDLEVLLGD